MTGVLAAVIIICLFLMNVWLYDKNKKTPVPEGCENLKPECGSCGIADCALRSRYEGDQ